MTWSRIPLFISFYIDMEMNSAEHRGSGPFVMLPVVSGRHRCINLHINEGKKGTAETDVTCVQTGDDHNYLSVH